MQVQTVPTGWHDEHLFHAGRCLGSDALRPFFR